MPSWTLQRTKDRTPPPVGGVDVVNLGHADVRNRLVQASTVGVTPDGERLTEPTIAPDDGPLIGWSLCMLQQASAVTPIIASRIF
jgi:hypothetical protein